MILSKDPPTYDNQFYMLNSLTIENEKLKMIFEDDDDQKTYIRLSTQREFFSKKVEKPNSDLQGC